MSETERELILGPLHGTSLLAPLLSLRSLASAQHSGKSEREREMDVAPQGRDQIFIDSVCVRKFMGML